MTALPVVSGETAGRFLARLAGFFVFLRRRGVPVGIGSELDLAQAFEFIALSDRQAVLDTCRATLAKSPRDARLVEEAFDEYWASLLREETEDPSKGAVPRNPPFQGSTRDEFSRSGAVTVESSGVMRIGVYSPDAPAVGHPLAALDPRRLAAVRAGARRFRRASASLPGRRFEPARQGRIDFPRTVRQSLRHGGEWLDLRRRRRKLQGAEFVVLWDVSGSMKDHDSELFALAYSLHRVARRSRIFAFSTGLEEVTDCVRAQAYSRALRAVSRTLGPASGGTRIGRCLQEFHRRHGSLVRPWTTVLVLSDGWDLGETDVLGRELGWLRRVSRSLVWINPYARRPSFEPATAGMREAVAHLDLLLGPEDFEVARPFRSAVHASVR